MTLRGVAVVLLGLALLTSLVATNAYSSAAADRDLSVAVVDDDEAYVGYESERVSVTNTGNETATATLVTVTNRFQSSIEVIDVAVDTGSVLQVDIIDDGGSIDPGTGSEIRAEISCDQSVTEPVPVSITVEGEHLRAALDGATERRLVDVSCTP